MEIVTQREMTDQFLAFEPLVGRDCRVAQAQTTTVTGHSFDREKFVKRVTEGKTRLI